MGVGLWSLIRFIHVAGAALWVGGQLALTLVVLPLARRLLDDEAKANFTDKAGRRFGILTGTVFLPLQLASGILIAWHKGVTWGSLLEPGYGRILTAKLALFVVVMLAAAGHGLMSAKGKPEVARTLVLISLVGSVGIVLLATALPAT